MTLRIQLVCPKISGLSRSIPSFFSDGIGTRKNLFDREGSGFLGWVKELQRCMVFGKHFGDSQWSPSTPCGELDEYRVSSIRIPRQFYMGVSKNRVTPKWIVYNGKPYQNGWFGGTTIFGNIHMVPFQGRIFFPKFPKWRSVVHIGFLWP